jgi:hypothetical protein
MIRRMSEHDKLSSRHAVDPCLNGGKSPVRRGKATLIKEVAAWQ